MSTNTRNIWPAGKQRNRAEQDEQFLCPRCLNRLLPIGYPGAISRADNQSEICSDCGTEEAMETMTVPVRTPREFAEEVKKLAGSARVTPVADWPVDPPPWFLDVRRRGV